MNKRKEEFIKEINNFKQFIIKIVNKIELKIFEIVSFDFDFDRKIIAVYKYKLILSKLKTFSKLYY